MADKSPLRRWKPFFTAFGAIDACIEAAAPEGCSRDKYRQVRGDIVELLCNASDDDDGQAEELCRLLDVAMAEELETLRVVPVTPAMLTTTDVAKAVGGLLGHESVRVRGLVCTVVNGWRASLEAALGTLLQISLDEHEVAAASPPVGRHWFKQEPQDLRHGVSQPEEDATWRSLAMATIASGTRRRQPTGAAKRKHPGAYKGCKAEADDVMRQ